MSGEVGPRREALGRNRGFRTTFAEKIHTPLAWSNTQAGQAIREISPRCNALLGKHPDILPDGGILIDLFGYSVIGSQKLGMGCKCSLMYSAYVRTFLSALGAVTKPRRAPPSQSSGMARECPLYWIAGSSRVVGR